MKVVIESASPDGLTVKFENKFFFHTWKEAFDFILDVDSAEHKPRCSETKVNQNG